MTSLIGKGKKGLSPEEALEFDSLLKKLQQIDLSEYAKELERGKDDRTKLVEALKANKAVTRQLAGKGRPKARKKQHWKVARKKKARYNEMVGEPRRKAKLANLLEEGGWYPYMMESWKKHKTEVSLTKEEWDERIAPLIGGSVPVLRRYDTKKPVTLHNVIVYDSTTRAVLYDGAEESLRENGYIL